MVSFWEQLLEKDWWFRNAFPVPSPWPVLGESRCADCHRERVVRKCVPQDHAVKSTAAFAWVME